RGALGVPDEVASRPVWRRFSPRPRRGLHRAERAEEDRVDGQAGRDHLANSGARLGGRMGLRVCLVTPFAWSRPHDVNEHVEGLATELRSLGHSVTVLAPSTRAADLIAGRRALLDGAADEVIALGTAVP